MAKILRFVLLLALALPFAACDSSEPEIPTFSVASVTVSDGADQFLQFVARPSTDVELSSVVIENPVGNTQTFNAGNQLILANDPLPLQDSDFGYFRVSGQWSFRFTGISDGGAGERFTVTTQINVSARVRN